MNELEGYTWYQLTSGAAAIIQKAWFTYRDRQMFKLLKNSLKAAEQSMAKEILRKISPLECAFLDGCGLEYCIRLRFGGAEFPPSVYFKVVVASAAVKYINGKGVIMSDSESARQACKRMGNRKFSEQLTADIIHQEAYKITSEADIATLKDFVQYRTYIDELPAHQGGKDNCWRKLTLSQLTRKDIFHDIFDYVYHKKLSPDLAQYIDALRAHPATVEDHVSIISQITSSAKHIPQIRSKSSAVEGSGRNSVQAQKRISKMRRSYMSRTTPVSLDKVGTEGESVSTQVQFSAKPITEDWEGEAELLYQWAQDLSLENLTPALES